MKLTISDFSPLDIAMPTDSIPGYSHPGIYRTPQPLAAVTIQPLPTLFSARLRSVSSLSNREPDPRTQRVEHILDGPLASHEYVSSLV